jgi:TonB family protein
MFGPSFLSLSLGLFLGLAALAAAPAACGQKGRADPQLLFEQLGLNDIRSNPAKPFNLHATLTLWANKGQSFTGTYDVYWLAEHNWCDIVRLPGYERTRVFGPHQMWQSRSLPYEPIRLYQLTEMLMEYQDASHMARNETIGKVSHREDKGTKLTCLTIRADGVQTRNLCLNPADSTLASEEYPDSRLLEFGDYQEYEGKQFPGLMRVTVANRKCVEVRVEKVAPLAPNTLFRPQPDAEVWDTCAHPSSIRMIGKLDPNFAGAARRNVPYADVVLYLVVEKDGTPNHLQVIEHSGADFDAAVVQAVQKLRFEPATCSGEPIRMETEFEFRSRSDATVLPYQPH